MQKLLLFAAAMLAACGGPPPADTKVEGSIGSIEFPRPFAIYGKTTPSALDGGRLFVLLSGNRNACSQLQSSGIFNRSAVGGPDNRSTGVADRVPSLYFQIADPSTSWSTEATLGNGLDANLDVGGPGWKLGDPAVAFVGAAAGALSLAQFDDLDASNARAAGTFNVSFNTGNFVGAMTGTFNATPCKALEPGCSSSAAGMAAPALLALIGALRRRRR